MVKKKTSNKTKTVLTAILIAVGSFIGGAVSEKNKALGGLIETVVKAFSLTVDAEPKEMNKPLYDTIVYVDTVVYSNSPFKIAAMDTFEIITKLNSNKEIIY